MPNLFDLLKNKNSDDLTDKVEKIDDFGIDDIEKKKEIDKYHVGKAISKIKTVSLWVTAIILGYLLLSLIISFTYLFIIYIKDVSSDIVSTKELLKNWLDYILIVLATLFIQSIFNKK